MSCRQRFSSLVICLIVAGIACSGAKGFAATKKTLPGDTEIPLLMPDSVDSDVMASGTDYQSVSRGPFDWHAWVVVFAAVAVLVGIRLFSKRKEASVPADVFELLGESTLGNGQSVRIVRFGPKTLLLANGSSGPMTLSELDDPLATEWIAAACRRDQTLRVARGWVPGGSATSERSPTHGARDVSEKSQSQGLRQTEVA